MPGGAVEPTVQQIVDSLAGRLGRPVIMEDRALRLIAYSSHDQPVDDVREASILRRRASPEVGRWLTELGVRQSRRPTRVPANLALGMKSRLCVPISWKERVLGHLWLVDPDESMGPDEIALCVQHADQLAVMLHRDSVVSSLATARLTDAVQTLLSSSPNALDAARILEADGDFAAPDGAVVAVIQGATTDPDWTVDIEDALSEALVGQVAVHRRDPALHVVRKDHGVLLIASPSDGPDRLGGLVAALTESVETELRIRCIPASVLVGVGGHRPRLELAAESYREARMAVDAATVLPGMPGLAYWSGLGVNQIVVQLASMGEKPPVLHAGLQALLDSPEAQPMIETLETYLDVAGNAQVTAERLNLHRTSLYYRLQRVEQLANTDLKDGLERLALHLTIKIARMTGDYDGANGYVRRKVGPQPLSTRAG
jgi:PucR C-terminal helix-turn-helix domain/GGDEF-like domain